MNEGKLLLDISCSQYFTQAASTFFTSSIASIAVLILTGSTMGYAGETGLCLENEQYYQGCRIAGGKQISFCKSGGEKNVLTYRFGRLNDIELEVRGKTTGPKKTFSVKSEAYARGGSSRVTFSRGKYTYKYVNLLSGTSGGRTEEMFALHGVKTNEVGIASHSLTHGLSVSRGGRELAYLTCADEARMLFGSGEQLKNGKDLLHIALTNQSASLISDKEAKKYGKCLNAASCAKVYADHDKRFFVVEICPSEISTSYGRVEGIYLIGHKGQYRDFAWFDPKLSRWACNEGGSGNYTLIKNKSDRIYGFEYKYDINLSHGRYLLGIEGFPEKLKIIEQSNKNDDS